jgi:hypothetical protein
MKTSVGYELIYSLPQPTPMILMVTIHYSRAADMIVPDLLTTDPSIPFSAFRDGFGNLCTRIVAPAGRIRLRSAGLVRDTGLLDPVVPYAQQHAVQDLPEETLMFLRGSRYCETDLLSTAAWQLFGRLPHGCLPRLRAPGHHILPLPEHSLAVLHRLPWRRGNLAAVRRPRFCSLDGSLSRWRVVYLRSAKQCTEDRASADRARTRRCGRRDRDHIRPKYSGELPNLD